MDVWPVGCNKSGWDIKVGLIDNNRKIELLKENCSNVGLLEWIFPFYVKG